MREMIRERQSRRRGAVVILAAVLLVVILGMVAFAIDMGYVVNVKSELQRAADAAALAGAGKLLDEEALMGVPDDTDERSQARADVHMMAAANPAGRVNLDALDADIEIGFVADPANPTVMSNAFPANAVHVLLRRDSSANGPLSLAFARAIGLDRQDLQAQATAIYEGGLRGYWVPPGSVNPSLLPYTLKIDDWEQAFLEGDDEWAVNSQTGEVTEGSDGIREVKLFPATGGNGKKGGGVVPGNFGTVDIGNPNNSTSDLARQIVYGPNDADFAYFPNSRLEFGPDGTLSLNGDTGISAGVKDELESIKGKPRSIPLYTTVSGNGNNAQFTIVRFVGIRIVDVKLTGSLANKHITIQPSFVVDPTTIRGGEEGVTSSYIRLPLRLIQ